MSSQRSISIEEIETGLRIVAGLIDRYGEAYWPLFDRLENELEVRRDRTARLRGRLRSENETRLAVVSCRN